MISDTKNLELTISNESESDDIPESEQFEHWFALAVNGHYQHAEVDILLVTEAQMSDINLETRNKKGPTNTLAFPFQFDDANIPLFGEIVMCPAVINAQAIEKGIPPLAHWAHLTLHSTLHLMGHDHHTDEEANEMEQIEIRLLQTLGFANPYEQ